MKIPSTDEEINRILKLSNGFSTKHITKGTPKFPAPLSDKLTQPKRELTKLITNILINYINN